MSRCFHRNWVEGGSRPGRWCETCGATISTGRSAEARAEVAANLKAEKIRQAELFHSTLSKRLGAKP